MRDENQEQIQLTQELDALRREVAELKQWKALHQENHGQDEVLQNALLRASRAILEHADFKTIARVIFDACSGLLGATSGYVALLSADGSENEVLFLEAGGRPCTVNPALPMPIRGLRSEAYRTGRAVYDNDFHNSVWMALMPKGHVRLDNVLFAPLNLEGKTVGLMGIANKPGGFTDDDALKAEAFGDLAAIALNNSRMIASLSRANKALSSAINAVLSTDLEGTIRYANAAAARMWGFSDPEEMISTDGIDYWTAESQKRAGEITAILFQKGSYSGEDLVAQRVDGSEFAVEVNAALMVDESGNPIGITSSYNDITKRKQMEQALIQEERHRIARELSAGMCHNLNNILNGISVPAQMLKSVTHDRHSLQDIEIIITSSQRAADLVHQLHVSVRGQTSEEPYSMDLNPVVEQVVALTRPHWQDQSEAKGITIEMMIERGELPPIRGTESGVREMIANLLFNAVEAMPEGGRIEIRTQVDGDFVRLSFRDTGVGMEEELLKRVFDPFFTTKMDVGSGLGLSMLHGTLTQWGGKVEVESASGKGTTFTLHFPVWWDPT